MGSANPRSFSRGKRGIAGTLVFVVFDHDALLKGLAEHVENNKVFHRIGKDINWKPMTIEKWDEEMKSIASQGDNNTTTTKAAGTRTRNISQQADPIIADEIPPFDITIEYASGYAA